MCIHVGRLTLRLKVSRKGINSSSGTEPTGLAKFQYLFISSNSGWLGLYDDKKSVIFGEPLKGIKGVNNL